MAMNVSEYKATKEKNIKVHKKDKRLFLFDFRIDGKWYRKFHKIEATNHYDVSHISDTRFTI